MSSIVILFGVIGLAIYIIVDIIQNRLRNILRRGIMYSFIFYLIVVGHLTIGDIQFPPHIGPVIIQLIPFKFITDWFLVGQAGDWFFWNSVKLSFFNLIMLFPLGVYLGLLFNINKLTRSIKYVFLVSLSIETLQLILTSIGFLFRRGFNVDDLILNTLGGVIGFIIIKLVMKTVKTHLTPKEKSLVN
jgi:glycopeptide antibiotics resistance protein